MAVDEKPPAWVPVDQQVGQVPIIISGDIDQVGVPPSSGQDPNKLANQIVRENQPVINRFVAMQRQQVEVGEKDFHSSVLPLKDMDVFYQNLLGIERLHYHITPKIEEPTPPAVQDQPDIELPAPPEVKEPEEPKAKEPEKEPEPEAPEAPKEKEPEEEKPPEAEEPEEEEPPKEEEEEKKKEEPEFLEIDVPCFLAVQFGAGGS
jgi:outer membrane biosynthesis protein TonB